MPIVINEEYYNYKMSFGGSAYVYKKSRNINR